MLRVAIAAPASDPSKTSATPRTSPKRTPPQPLATIHQSDGTKSGRIRSEHRKMIAVGTSSTMSLS
jgi:hypothetical protein